MSLRSCARPRVAGPVRALGTSALAVVALAAISLNPARAAENSEKDWPCRQILVEKISLPAVWSGPPVENIDWSKTPTMADRVKALAARRLSVEDAEREVQNFAATFDASRRDEKKTELTALFAGLFETLSSERAQVVSGLIRFGRRQKELAQKIRAENATLHSQSPSPPVPTPVGAAKEAQTDPRALEWDLRIFDERRQALTYVCETPTLIEQRLFALARVIQQNLE
ncbi:hypothetical protein [Methylocapsa palsarum]|uniref:LTXXQ motif family protein n=1 Tax=Methylocapsa palsarum TaxID=1612308 RepID=A0A1I3Z5A0_9HYPH|nr:hypothetical protein [Methylocapsa palsarum]SFK38699.1 hypothetical protein SAMN05444581_10752 [Methylocapsa palsarum]